MKNFNQVVTVELTTDQVILSLATLSATMAEIQAWLSSRGEDTQQDAIDSVKETYGEIKELYNVFVVARQNIEQSWTK